MKNPILTFYGRLVNVSLDQIIDCELLIHPDGKVVEKQALAINGIDLDEHCQVADAPEIASAKLEDFLRQCQRLSPGNKFYTVGHHVKFDMGFIEQLIPNFSDTHGRSCLDTRMFSTALLTQGLVMGKSASLQSMRQALSIEKPEAVAHSHRGDVDVMHELLRDFFARLRKGSQNDVTRI